MKKDTAGRYAGKAYSLDRAQIWQCLGLQGDHIG